jgi:hypothetical protein
MKKIILYSILFLIGGIAYSQSNSSLEPKGEIKQEQRAQTNLDDTVSAYKDIPDTLALSPAYPNPSNVEMSIDYSIPSDVQEVRFAIYNLLGRTVKEIAIDNYNGSLTVNTSGMPEGIYFYSFLINREPATTHKLIIKH